jgi:hypothetical protein
MPKLFLSIALPDIIANDQTTRQMVKRRIFGSIRIYRSSGKAKIKLDL